ncbi:Uncharacterised protein [Mycobacteroides abscessus subsp. abscessus]|nr:Uncharacterised protein [Mycobacteroides abscessus subsp. abscessus]
MLRHGRLADRELRSDDFGDCAGGHLPRVDQFQDASAHRISEYVEGVHVTNIKRGYLYKSRLNNYPQVSGSNRR